jgi:hypothetical protein
MKYTKEGDDTVEIEIYRMGGRGGRAVANIAISPVAPEGDTVNAAGFNDFTVTSGLLSRAAIFRIWENSAQVSSTWSLRTANTYNLWSSRP